MRRARNVLPQVELSDNFLDLATFGGSHVDFAGQVGLTAVGRARPFQTEVLHHCCPENLDSVDGGC
jgi:hypothetical protein